MNSSVEPINEPKTDNVEPADDWENEESESAMQNQLQERFRQVKILQREQADKDARIEKARQDEAASKSAKTEASPSPQQTVMPVKMQILRRPQSYDQLEEAAKAKREQEEKEKKKLTFEERHARYESARNRILGTDYKPEPSVAQPSTSPAVSRNRSPEQVQVRRPSPETAYIPSFKPSMYPGPSIPPPPNCGYPHNMQHMNYGVPMTTAQPFMPYLDTSRPPPLINTMAGPSMHNYNPQQIPTYGTGQYFGGSTNGQFMSPQPPSNCVPYGRPALAVYPPGTIGAAMQITMETGQSQAQRKNRHKKKNKNNQDTDAVPYN